MTYYLIEYITRDGEHEYTEFAVTAAKSFAQAEKRAARGLPDFQRLGWEEFCEVSHLMPIPKDDFAVLRKYFLDLSVRKLSPIEH